MKVLFISRVNPFLNNGGAFATRAYLDAFSDLAEKCTALICDNAIIPEEYSSIVDFIPVPDRRVFNKLLFPFTKITHRFIPFIYSLAKQNDVYADYDTIVINGSVIAGSMVDYFKSIEKKVITIHHNVEHFYHKDNKTIDSFGGHMFYIVDGNEKNAIIKSDLNLSISRADIKELRSYYNLNDINTFRYLGCFEYKNRINSRVIARTVDEKQLIITGSLCDIQTKESINDFLRIYYPVLYEKYPDHKLIVAGRNPDAIITTTCKELGIDLIANPNSMDDLVKASGIYLCPTFLGSGLKLRIMDALRNGIPVVTHAISARGYESFFEKKYFKVYSSIPEFISSIDYITQNKTFREDIIKDYYDEFSYKSGVNRLKDILKGENYI